MAGFAGNGRDPGGSLHPPLHPKLGARIALRRDPVGSDEREALGPHAPSAGLNVEAVARGQVEDGVGSSSIDGEVEPGAVGDEGWEEPSEVPFDGSRAARP